MFSEALVEQSGDSARLKSVHWQKYKSTIFSFVKQSLKILKYCTKRLVLADTLVFASTSRQGSFNTFYFGCHIGYRFFTTT